MPQPRWSCSGRCDRTVRSSTHPRATRAVSAVVRAGGSVIVVPPTAAVAPTAVEGPTGGAGVDELAGVVADACASVPATSNVGVGNSVVLPTPSPNP